jgi:predicted nucleotidyltransferase
MVAGELLTEIRDRLATAYGLRFRGAVLYGSEARGEAGPDRDIGSIALLEGPIDLGKDIHTSTAAVYPLMRKLERVIDIASVDFDAYERGVMTLYRDVRAEGTLL